MAYNCMRVIFGEGGRDECFIQATGILRVVMAVVYLVLSSFSSSMSLRDALTLLDTSLPWENSRCRSLKVMLSGAPGAAFSCSWLRGGGINTSRN